MNTIEKKEGVFLKKSNVIDSIRYLILVNNTVSR